MFISLGLKLFESDNFLCYSLLAWQQLFSNIFDLFPDQNENSDMIQEQSFTKVFWETAI